LRRISNSSGAMWSLSPERLPLSCVLLLLALVCDGGAAAEELRLAPSFTLRQEYNDNLLFSTTGEEQSFITSISPALELSRRSERLEARLAARMNGLLYEGKSSMNSIDHAYNGGLNYRVTPLLKLGVEVEFARQSRPDRGIESTGLVEVARDSRQLYSLSGETVWTEKTTSSLSYAFEKIDYDNRGDLRSQSHLAGLGVTHDLGLYLAGLQGRGNLGFNRNIFSAARVDNYSATVGASYALHELWSATADAGVRYTRLETTSTQPTAPGAINQGQTSGNAGWVANLTLSYRGEFSRANLTFLRNVMVASGLGGAAERTALVFDLNHRLSQEFFIGTSAGYYLNQSDRGEFSGQPIDETTLRINPFVRYAFSPELMLDASYQYTRIVYHLVDSAAGQNRFLIRLVARWQLLD
jgi:hypothetical protein